MSTRSNISVYHPKEGVYKTVYCHKYGYLDGGVGETLISCYNTQEKAESVVALGNLSYLECSMEKPEGHSLDTPVGGCSVAYHRDGGETFEANKPHILETTDPDVFKQFDRSYVNLFDYHYVWNGKAWYVLTDEGYELVSEILGGDA